MGVEEAAAVFAALPAAEKAEFLAVFSYELTLVGRDAYEAGTLGLTHAARLRAVNEVQHRVAAFLASLLRNDARRCPDDVLVRIIHDHHHDAAFAEQVAAAFARALAAVRAA